MLQISLPFFLPLYFGVFQTGHPLSLIPRTRLSETALRSILADQRRSPLRLRREVSVRYGDNTRTQHLLPICNSFVCLHFH